ncbi:MAG: SDR family NAD(P)-dependent oxidoreductase, partial [Pseudomonadota bacterium]
MAATAREIAARVGRSIGAEVCDISERAAVRRVIGGLGHLDVLVNNAGLELITPMLEPGDEVETTFERIIQIKLVGTCYVTRDAVK